MGDNNPFTRTDVNYFPPPRPSARPLPRHIADCHSGHRSVAVARPSAALLPRHGDFASSPELSPSPPPKDQEGLSGTRRPSEIHSPVSLPSPAESNAHLLKDGSRPMTPRSREWSDRVQWYMQGRSHEELAVQEVQQVQRTPRYDRAPKHESIPRMIRHITDGARSIKSEVSSHPSRLPEPVPVLPGPSFFDEDPDAEPETPGRNKLRKSPPGSIPASKRGSTEKPLKSILKPATPPRKPSGYLTSPGFWMVMIGACLAGVVSAMEATILSTALPTIVNELQGGELYMWAANAYFLSSAVFQPLYAQAARLFSRRWLALLSIGLFAAGGAICGAAPSIQVLIAGRTIQGFGGSGITTLVNFIVADLVPAKSRGRFLAVIFTTFTVGNGIGPFLGGFLVERVSWRWVFWVILPPSALSFLLILFFHRVQGRTQPALPKLKRLDYVGYIIFIGSMVALLFAVTVSGTTAQGADWHQLVPLAVGAVGFVVFMLYEASSYCKEPIVPPRLFANRTSASAFVLSFLHSMATIWVIYWLPIYFQGVQGSGPLYSGIQLLPTVLVLVPFAAFSSKLLAWMGHYRPLQFTGFAMIAVGFAMFALFQPDSSPGKWIGFQVLLAAGGGLVVSGLLPAVQAGLRADDRVIAISTWGFIRNFGILWGVAIPSALFNNQINNAANMITNQSIRAELLGGRAYELATAAFASTLPRDTAAQLQQVYANSLQAVWFAATGVAGVAFLLVFLEADIRVCRKRTVSSNDQSQNPPLQISSPQRSETIVASPLKSDTISPIRSDKAAQISPFSSNLEAGETPRDMAIAERMNEKGGLRSENGTRPGGGLRPGLVSRDTAQTVHVYMEGMTATPRSKYNPPELRELKPPPIPTTPPDYGRPRTARTPWNLKNSWAPWGRRHSRYESWYSSGTERSERSDHTHSRQSTGSEWGRRVSRLMEELELEDEWSQFGEWESSRRSNSSLNF